ncbi:MAG: DUF922 domain-containing protein [Nitrospirae bacterium]|nr:DUF922 domain-containing protein [Nitrospirota bacterium]
MAYQRILIVFIASFMLSSPAFATVFQYFDEEGTLIVTDNPFGIKKSRTSDSRQPVNQGGIIYEYYPVSGNTFAEIMSSTNVRGPLDVKDNRRYAGQTRWNMGWTYRLESSYRIEDGNIIAALNVSDVEIRPDIRILLPALSEDAAPALHDRRLWEGFFQGLLEHEHDHVRLIKDPLPVGSALQKISGIRSLVIPYDPAYAPDEVIKNAVEAETARIGHDLLKEIKKRNDEYDRLTEHGLKPEKRVVFFQN